MTIEQLATRLGWTPRHVRRFLAGQSKTNLDKLGETTFAIDGSLIKFTIRER